MWARLDGLRGRDHASKGGGPDDADKGSVSKRRIRGTRRTRDVFFHAPGTFFNKGGWPDGRGTCWLGRGREAARDVMST